MKIHFLGANRQVTGSRYCIETTTSRVMVDCGLFQEREYSHRNWHESTINPSTVDAMVLTHGHIDHSGLVPKMVKDGLRAPIFATPPTVDLVEIMLKDAARIQKEDAEYKKKRHKKQGKKSRFPPEPIYDEDDVGETIKWLRVASYHEPTPIADGVSVTFHDAGHILGSAIVEFRVEEEATTKTIVFSGDIGQAGKPLIRDPDVLTQADVLVMESTYGDRDHPTSDEDVEAQFATVINATVEAGGKTIIPTFAVERAQEIMYHLARLAHQDKIPDIEVFLDSPMAVDVTNVFRQHRNCLDQETRELIESGSAPLRFPGLHMARSADESRRINAIEGPCIIMSTSGMCTAGRIKHHLKRNISDPRNTILFVGYQAHGTLGRLIVDGRDKVRIHGKERQVKASVRQIYGFSGHADRGGLLRWSQNFERAPSQTFLTHGDEEAAMALAETLRSERGWNVQVPQYEATIDI